MNYLVIRDRQFAEFKQSIYETAESELFNTIQACDCTESHPKILIIIII